MSKTWRQILEQSKGEYHIYCKTLETGRTMEHQPDDILETASVVKLPILLALLVDTRGHTHVFSVMSLVPNDPKRQIGPDAAWRIEFAGLAAALFTDLEAG
jgi:beta-lactamase class A